MNCSSVKWTTHLWLLVGEVFIVQDFSLVRGDVCMLTHHILTDIFVGRLNLSRESLGLLSNFDNSFYLSDLVFCGFEARWCLSWPLVSPSETLSSQSNINTNFNSLFLGSISVYCSFDWWPQKWNFHWALKEIGWVWKVKVCSVTSIWLLLCW